MVRQFMEGGIKDAKIIRLSNVQVGTVQRQDVRGTTSSDGTENGNSLSAHIGTWQL